MQKIFLIVLTSVLAYLLFQNLPVFLTSQIAPSHSRQVSSQGNLTKEMEQTLKQLIDNSTELYRRYRLNDMATYISNGMKKSFGDQWQVFVFGQDTLNCSFSSNTVSGNQWAIWEQYGLYDLCYVIYRTKSCLKSITEPEPEPEPSYSQLIRQPSYQQQWGYSFTDPDKERVLFLFDQASSYGGANMTLNSQYIIQKIGSGGWAVAIGGPSNGIGMSTCYFRGYYAFLVDYTDLLWTYALIRQF